MKENNFNNNQEFEKGSGFNGVLQYFNKIKISIASPEQILSWSHGEVKKSETINYRTLKAGNDGLFCQKIFGPSNDYECACGKYKRIRYAGKVCDKCGVEVAPSVVRRERMGHIKLTYPVAHIWYFKSFGSRMSYVLNINANILESVINFENYIVLDPGDSNLTFKQILNYGAACKYLNDESNNVNIASGAEAIKHLLQMLDLEIEYAIAKKQYNSTKAVAKKAKISKRMQILDMFIQSGVKPEHMILDVIPVLPPELRPLVPLDGGRLAVSDLNDLYRRVINRNNRLKRLNMLNAPDIIILNEKRMLQDAVNVLLDNSKTNKPMMSANGKRTYKSLSDLLKGKQGRFRQNLLGKRVDYSGRSVIVVGPELKLHQCGLPKYMALELFKPHVYGLLERRGIAPTIRVAKYMVETEKPEVWDVLDEVIRNYLVLLNRAPTLHRLGIQAFEPKLTDGNAIKLHPLTCAAFNADFDGDQMAVHVPLSCQAQAEARNLILSTRNILSPASGEPTIVPTKDIVLGIYYLTLAKKDVPADDKMRTISDKRNLNIAYSMHHVDLHDHIFFIFGKNEKVCTTVGRVILYYALDEVVDFSLLNKTLDKGAQKAIINHVYNKYSHEKTVFVADEFMRIGFEYATRAGISISKNDLTQPKEKWDIIAEAEKVANSIEEKFEDGMITTFERYNKIVDLWSSTTEKITDILMENISNDQGGFNSVYLMSDSGARGSREQIRQLCGMRGLMAKPSGEIILNPIKANFREGLSVHDYFNSTHGARKGMADTALKTANSGYLTRRLVDVAQDLIVTSEDCGTEEYITIANILANNVVMVDVLESLFSRVMQEDIKDINDNVIVAKGDFVDDNAIQNIKDANITQTHFKVRSVLRCHSKGGGVCAKCYGIDLSNRKQLVATGLAVGIIAAQSIGEPGTQLTMRTFHEGGAASKEVDKSEIIAQHDGHIVFDSVKIVGKSAKDGYIVVSHAGKMQIKSNKKDNDSFADFDELPRGARVFFKDGESVNAGDIVARWEPHSVPIIAEIDGFVEYSDLQDGASLAEGIDNITGVVGRHIIDWRKSNVPNAFNPSIIVVGTDGTRKQYFMAVGANIEVQDGQKVIAGDTLAKISKHASKTRDITGGLPRITELFEARRSKNPSVISPIDGYLSFNSANKLNRKLNITNPETGESVVLSVPKNAHLLAYEGDFVKKGQMMMDATPELQDILTTLGFEKLIDYMISEVQAIYRMQGVSIHSKHIEIIIRQMLCKAVIIDQGDSKYITGKIVNISDIVHQNSILKAENKKEIQYQMTLQGITRVSLQTDSWLSAASFQETSRILIDAAIQNKSDSLKGLKENVTVGRIMPAGAGFILHKKVAELGLNKHKNVSSNDFVPNEDDNRDAAAADMAVDMENIFSNI